MRCIAERLIEGGVPKQVWIRFCVEKREAKVKLYESDGRANLIVEVA
jgi:hypothetical protein